MKATVAVLPKEVTRPTVFVRILEGDQLVEELDEFIKDEVVVDNVPDEFSRHQGPNPYPRRFLETRRMTPSPWSFPCRSFNSLK